jgi:hypothetical protein
MGTSNSHAHGRAWAHPVDYLVELVSLVSQPGYLLLLGGFRCAPGCSMDKFSPEGERHHLAGSARFVEATGAIDVFQQAARTRP